MSMAQEEWRDVVGFEGLYQVSNFGRVKSLDRWCIRSDGQRQRFSGVMMKAHANRGSGKRGQRKGRYLSVELSREHKHRFFLVHRLVLEAFVPNPDPKIYTQCNHKDENTHNNHVSNLEWCSPVQNINYGTRNERANSKIRKRVQMLSKNGEVLKEFCSTKDAERQTGVWSSSISCCCRNLPNFNTAGGYRWQFAQLAQ
jgi:hypothetical protein